MSQSNDDLNVPILNLSAQEKTAYSYLFNLADADSLNVVTGERAVTFFEKTSVPEPVLGEAWQIADTENRGFLTKPGFCMVLRLIGWYQNGQHHPTTELAFKQAPLPVFEGMTLPGATASPTAASFPPGALQPQLSGQTTGSTPIRVPPLDPAKVQQYSSAFARSGAQNGLLNGAAAKNIFEKAGLPNEVLGRIWMLADREQRGSLDETEFIVAMHLLTCMKSRTMTGLPNTLPPGLYEAAARRGQRPPSRQTSIQTGPVSRQLTGSGVNTIPRTQSPLARPSSTTFATPQVQSAQPTGTHWLVTQQEKAQYDQFFSTIDTSGKGVISGEQAVRFFSDSRLPEDSLASIWDLADINSEGSLNRDEFAVAMYLIRQQRMPNASPLPPFLPAALVPPSMRGPQQNQQVQRDLSQSSAFAPPSQPPARAKSAADDLFGLDSPIQAPASPAPVTLQPQSTGASATRDPFGGSQPGSPSPASPARFQAQNTGGNTFKPFVPTSAFGASLASQNTGGSAAPSQAQQQSRGLAAAAPSSLDDLLGDNDANAQESRSITNDSTELANMSNQIGNLRNQMETTQSKRSMTETDLNATNAQKRDLEQRLQQFRAQYETEVRTVKEMEQQLAASKESTKKLSQEFAMLQGTHQDLQTQHSTINQQLQADQQENASLKQKISQINAEVSSLKPQIEKMKLDARQQKGLVSINKKQLATNEAERDRLQSEKADLERGAAEQARSLTTSPEPAAAATSSSVVSPAASTLSSTNPFFRRTTTENVASPSPAAPNPSAFDAIFGPSTAFAPTGQTSSRSGTPPATSFIGRSMPEVGTATAVGAGVAAVGAAAIGGTVLAHSMSSTDERTPSATPSLSDRTKDTPIGPSDPPPPPESSQFTPTSLPLNGSALASSNKAESVASSTRVMPPASRAGGAETPREAATSPAPGLSAFAAPPSGAEPETETIPGAFPSEEHQPSTVAREINPSNGLTPEEEATPLPATKPANDFDSAFASFGEGEKSRDVGFGDDPFAPSSSQPTKTADHEFPPIQDLGGDEDSDSEDEGARGFGDSFTTAFPPRNDVVASSSAMAGATAVTASELPDISKESSPPTYENIGDVSQGSSLQPNTSNSFPREYGELLPAREDPTSPPPPPEDQAVAGPPDSSAIVPPAQAGDHDDFVDASSRPLSSVADVNSQTATAPAASRNVFDEFDDFNDLSEAQEHDKTGNDLDFFGRQSHDEFNPAFDTPTASQTPTPAKSIPNALESNGFANFTPNASTSSASAFAPGASSVQQTPENMQHDWDAIFSGLDSNKSVGDSSAFGNASSDEIWQPPPGPPPGRAAITTNGTAASIPAPTPLSASTMKPAAPSTGRAITPGTEHDDPILKRLTGMGYPRTDALRALERYDYDINKAVDHLTSS